MKVPAVLLATIFTAAAGVGAASAQVANGSTVAGSTPTTFTATGTFGDNSTLSGAIVIDTTNGSVVSGDLFVTQPQQQALEGLAQGNAGISYEFNNLTSGGIFVDLGGQNVWSGIDFADPGVPAASLELDLFLPNQSGLVGYHGGLLCTNDRSTGGPCGEFGAYFTNYSLFSETQFPQSGLAQSAESPAGGLAVGELDQVTTPEPASLTLLLGPALWVIRRRRR